MEKIKQTDKRFPHVINRFACNFRSLLAIPEMFFGMKFSAENIMYAYIQAINREPPAMDNECTIKYPDPIINFGIDLLGLGHEYRGFQVGRKEDGREYWWGWGKIDKAINYTILKGNTSNNNDHFRLGNKRGVLLWDPADDVDVISEEMIIYYQVRKVV